MRDVEDISPKIWGDCELCKRKKKAMQVYILGSFPASLCNKCRRSLQHELLYQPEFIALRAIEAAKQKAIYYNDHEGYNELIKLDDSLRRGVAPFIQEFMGDDYEPKFKKMGEEKNEREKKTGRQGKQSSGKRKAKRTS